MATGKSRKVTRTFRTGGPGPKPKTVAKKATSKKPHAGVKFQALGRMPGARVQMPKKK